MIGPGQGEAYLKMKLKDQNKAMQILQESPSLQGLNQIQAPYVDLEVRGLPALQYFGNLVWQDAFKDQTGLSACISTCATVLHEFNPNGFVEHCVQAQRCLEPAVCMNHVRV